VPALRSPQRLLRRAFTRNGQWNISEFSECHAVRTGPATLRKLPAALRQLSRLCVSSPFLRAGRQPYCRIPQHLIRFCGSSLRLLSSLRLCGGTSSPNPPMPDDPHSTTRHPPARRPTHQHLAPTFAGIVCATGVKFVPPTTRGQSTTNRLQSAGLRPLPPTPSSQRSFQIAGHVSTPCRSRSLPQLPRHGRPLPA